MAPPAQVPPATAAASAADAPPVVELHHSRRAASRSSWIWVALPVGGLLIVPAIGLVYAATTTFGKASAEPTLGSAGADDDDEGGVPGTLGSKASKKPKRTTSGSRVGKTSTKPRSDSASACCAKLHELGKTAAVIERAPYLSAAAACDAAPDAEKAISRAKANLKTAKAELPEECEN